MCGNATLAIVVSIACMIVASMIEIVMAARLILGAAASGASLPSRSAVGGRRRLWLSPVAKALPAAEPGLLIDGRRYKQGTAGTLAQPRCRRMRYASSGG